MCLCATRVQRDVVIQRNVVGRVSAFYGTGAGRFVVGKRENRTTDEQRLWVYIIRLKVLIEIF